MVTSVQKVIGSVPVKDLYFYHSRDVLITSFLNYFLAFFLIYAGF